MSATKPRRAGLNGVILGTRDGGRCWEIRRFEGDLTNGLTVYALEVSDGPVVWAAGNGGNIFASRDLGQFWFPVRGLAFQAVEVLRRTLATDGR